MIYGCMSRGAFSRLAVPGSWPLSMSIIGNAGPIAYGYGMSALADKNQFGCLICGRYGQIA